MDQPVTDPTPGTDAATDATTDATTEWLIDADDPLLSAERLARVADDRLPDRLVWNTFRTLGLWNTEAWVPSMLEVACGRDNVLSPLEWDGAQIVPWGAGLKDGDLCDVVLDGPAAYVVVACSASGEPSEEEVRAAAVAALDGSLSGGREAGLVLVVPPGAPDPAGVLERAGEVPLLDGRLVDDLLAARMGFVEWPYLGTLALDLAEENDPEPQEQVRRLVSQLQARFPSADI